MSLQTTTLAASAAYAKLHEQGAGAVKYLNQRKLLVQQPTCSAEVILALVQHCSAVIVRLDAWSVPGLTEYARMVRNDPAYDIAADIAALRAGYVTLRDSLMTRFPQDGNGWLLYQSFDVNGGLQTRTFTAAQLADVVAMLDAVIAVFS